jgi:hypothetical protein
MIRATMSDPVAYQKCDDHPNSRRFKYCARNRLDLLCLACCAGEAITRLLDRSDELEPFAWFHFAPRERPCPSASVGRTQYRNQNQNSNGVARNPTESLLPRPHQ